MKMYFFLCKVSQFYICFCIMFFCMLDLFKHLVRFKTTACHSVPQVCCILPVFNVHEPLIATFGRGYRSLIRRYTDTATSSNPTDDRYDQTRDRAGATSNQIHALIWKAEHWAPVWRIHRNSVCGCSRACACVCCDKMCVWVFSPIQKTLPPPIDTTVASIIQAQEYSTLYLYLVSE